MNQHRAVARLSALSLAFLSFLLVLGCGSDRSPGSIRISSDTTSFSVGATVQLIALDTSSIKQTTDVTNIATWTSTNPAVATVNNSGLVTGISAGSATVTATLKKDQGSMALSITPPAVTGISLSPASAALLTGATQVYTATASYADHAAGAILTGVQWSVAPASVATITASGTLTAVAPGSFAVTATVGNFSGAAVGSVSNASLTSVAITPGNATITGGGAQQFTATGTYVDGSTQNVTQAVTWISSNPALLGITATGYATAQGTNATTAVTITAQLGGVTGTTQATVIPGVSPSIVALVVTPTSSSVAMHTGTQLVATGYYADGTQKDITSAVNWTSTNAAVSSVNTAGTITAGVPGSATITAEIPVAANARHGLHSAVADTTTLQSQSVSLVTPATLVSLTADSGDTDTAPYLLPVGTTNQARAFGVFSDGTKQDLSALVTWQSNAPAIATITPQGAAVGVAPGTTAFTAAYSGYTATTPSLTVTNSPLSYETLSSASATTVNGLPLQLSLTGHFSDGSTQDLTNIATFTSSDPTIISVNQDGLTFGVSTGLATLTASAFGQSATVQMDDVGSSLQSITIVPSTTQFALGTTQQFQALGLFPDGGVVDVSSAVIWTSSAPTVLTIDSNGLAKSGSTGSAILTASLIGVTGTSGAVQVSPATLTKLVVSPDTAQQAAKTNLQFTAIGTFSDGTTQDVTADVSWSSANLAVAPIENTGFASALAPGTTRVTASLGGQTASNSSLIVTDATLVSTVVMPAHPVIGLNTSEQLHLIGAFSDGTTQDLTTCGSWTSSDNSAAFPEPTLGLINGLGVGNASVTATCGGSSAFTVVNIVAKTLVSLALTPSQGAVSLGDKQVFALIGTFSDGSTQEIDQNVTWGTSNALIATLAGGVPGEAIGISTGLASISGSYNGLTAPNATLRVLDKPLVSLAVTPVNPSVPAGSSQQFTATGTNSDGSTEDYSQIVTWTSSNPALLTIDQTGHATAQSTNTTTQVTVTAQLGSTTGSTPVQVTPPGATLTALYVIPTSSSIANTTAEQHTALAYYSDGSQKDVTSQVAWSVAQPTSSAAAGPHSDLARATGGASADRAAGKQALRSDAALHPEDATANGVVSVNQNGVDTGTAAGTSLVQATLGSTQAQSVVIVNPVTITALAVRATRGLFPVGAKQQIQLIGSFSDGSQQDLSLTANWQSSNTAVATIDSNTGMATGVSGGPVQFTGSFGGLTASSNGFQVLAFNLLSTLIDAPHPSAPVGLSQNLSVVGTYSDGSVHDLTALATWSSADPSVYTVDSTGFAVPVGPGTTQITATVAGQQAITTLSTANAPTTNNTITISAVNFSIPLGASENFTGRVNYANGPQVDATQDLIWYSNDPAVLTVAAGGRVKSGKLGSTTLTANGASTTQTSAVITITNATLNHLAIAPNTAQIAEGTGQQFSATGTFTDGTILDSTQDVAWSTSDNTIASIDATGHAQGIKPGTVQISATWMGLTVSSPLLVTNATLQSVKVLPGNTELPTLITRQFTFIGTFSDGTSQDLTDDAIWTTSTPTLLTIQFKGEVLGLTMGEGEVTAQRGYFSASTPVNVTDATLTSIALNPASTVMRQGMQQQLVATGTFSDGFTQDLALSADFTSGNTLVATNTLLGLVYGVGVGSTQITAAAEGQSASTTQFQVLSNVLTSLSVTPSNPSIDAGATQQFRAIGTYQDGTTADLSSQVTWASSNPAALSVDENGNAIAVSSGSGSITVSAQSGGATGAVSFTILPAGTATLSSIAVTPANGSVAAGTTSQLTATGTYSDGSTRNLTNTVAWSSSNASVATVSSTGVASGVVAGMVTIQAQFGSVTGQAPLTVTTATLSSVAVSPTTSTISVGNTQQFTLTGTFTDGSMQNVTSAASWTSSAPSTASISSAGLARGASVGSVQFTGTYGGRGATTGVVQVTAASLVSVAVSPNSAQIADGATQQFTLTGTYSDGTTSDLSASATWTSSAPGTATIGAMTGLATGVTTGGVQFTATYNGQSATTGTVQITPAALVSIAITPTMAQIAKGTSQQFVATGTYSDGSTSNISSSVTWGSSNGSAVSINATGLATGVGVGSTQITASFSGQSASVSGIQGTPATLVSLSFNPPNPSVAAGTDTQVAVIGTYSDGSTQNLSSAAGTTYSSSSPSTATVSSSGVVTGVGVGSSTITVTAGGMTSSFAVNVTNATLMSLAITPNPPTALAKGTTEQFTATGTFSDNSTQNLSSSVTWGSSNTSALTINSTGLSTGVATGATTVTANYQSRSATTPSFQVTPAALTSLTVEPTSTRIANTTSTQFKAIGSYTDGSVQDLTSSVTWTSLDSTIATINASGAATGVASGQVQVKAQSGSLQSQGTLIVSSATLVSTAISPNSVNLQPGAPQQFSLIGTFSDGSQQDLTEFATWTSSSPSTATISSTGLATGVANGSVQFTGSYGGQSSTTGASSVTTATLTSIAVTPASPTFADGTSQQLTVTGTYSDMTTANLTSQAVFTSSNGDVVEASSGGLVTGLQAGTATVSIMADGQATTTGTITVTPATLTSIAITPNTPSFANGTTQQFSAIGTFSDGTMEDLTSQVLWASTNPQTATINASGLASGGSTGTTQISASLDGVTATTGTATVTAATITSLSLSPTTASIANGTTQQFSATGTFTDGTSQNLTNSVTWASNDSAVATINASGLATAAGTGSAQISATYGAQTATTSSFVVTQATLVSVAFNPPNPSVAAGTTAQVTVTGTFSDGTTQNLTNSSTYTSSNPSAVTVSTGGVVTGVAPGTSTITVQVDGNTSSFNVTVTSATLSSISIAPANPPSIVKGTTQQFTATGHFTDGSTQDLSSSVTWGSTNTNVVSINTTGLAMGTGVGSAAISATYQGQSASTATFQVTAATVSTITVSPASASIQSGATQQYTAMASYTDGSMQDVSTSVTWTSSSPGVATISTAGLASGVGAGNTTITATLNSVMGTASLAVTVATPPQQVTLSSITVTPSGTSIAQGGTQQYTATGTYSDGSTQNLTSSVSWYSSSTSVATITSAGLASGTGGGMTQISASYSGKTGMTTLTVNPATLTSLTVTPATASVAAGTTQQYQAMGNFSDGSTQNLTTAVTWTSSNTSYATINQSGLASSSTPGTTTIKAQSGTVSGTATLTVTNATVLSVQVSPASATLAVGNTQQLTVTATFTDTSSQNVTSSATYSSSNPSAATVSTGGKVTAVGTGSSTITATLGSQSANSAITVTAAALTSISVTPANVSLAVGTNQQLTATGTFSDGSTANLTSSVTWSSSAASVASVSTTGNVTASQTGSATISATSGSIVGHDTITDTPAVISSISVTPASTNLAAGQTQQYTAIATLSDGSQQTVTTSAHWSVSDATKASISNTSGSNGLLTSSAAGSDTVSAAIGSVNGSASVTITSATLTGITITPAAITLEVGLTQQLDVLGTYSDGSNQDLTNTATYTSSAPSAGTVSSTGLVTSTGTGTATITAAVGAVSDSAVLTSTPGVLLAVAVTPATPTIPNGLTQQFTATGTFTGASQENITSQVQWTSSNTTVASISTAGIATALHGGTSTITATSGTMSGNTVLTVGAATLTSITVGSIQNSVPLGFTLQMSATGHYSDGTTANLTSSVTWTSLSTSIGVVSTAGVANGKQTGVFQVQASLNGLSGTKSITVDNATLQTITVTPANSTVVLNGTTQFTATGTFSDGSTLVLTTGVHWTLAAGTVPVLVGSISQSGMLSATSVGVNNVVTATYGTTSGTTTVTVVTI